MELDSKVKDNHKYVIDASITGIDNLFQILEGKKIVLTSVTIRELEKLQKWNFNSSKGIYWKF